MTWRQRVSDITPRARGPAAVRARMRGVPSRPAMTDHPTPHVYCSTGINEAVDFIGTVRGGAVSIVICHFDSWSLRFVPEMMARLRGAMHDVAMVVMTLSTVPHAVDGLMGAAEQALQRKLWYTNMQPPAILPGPSAVRQFKIICRTLPNMSPPDLEHVELLSQAHAGLKTAYTVQIEGMEKQKFDTVLRDWCYQLQNKHMHARIICVTYHERAQIMLESALRDDGGNLNGVTVWTVAQIHRSRAQVASGEGHPPSTPHILIFCEPQLNPWDAWFCIAALGADASMRVAVCMWSHLDTASHALDNERYMFITDWSEAHAALARQWTKKQK